MRTFLIILSAVTLLIPPSVHADDIPSCRHADMQFAKLDAADEDKADQCGGEMGTSCGIFSLKNVSGHACSLFGVPRMKLLDAKGKAIPFKFVHGGGVFITPHGPRRFTIPAGGKAFITADKYRCDAGELVFAEKLQLFLPQDQTPMTEDGLTCHSAERAIPVPHSPFHLMNLRLPTHYAMNDRITFSNFTGSWKSF